MIHGPLSEVQSATDFLKASVALDAVPVPEITGYAIDRILIATAKRKVMNHVRSLLGDFLEPIGACAQIRRVQTGLIR